MMKYLPFAVILPLSCSILFYYSNNELSKLHSHRDDDNGHLILLFFFLSSSCAQSNIAALKYSLLNIIYPEALFV